MRRHWPADSANWRCHPLSAPPGFCRRACHRSAVTLYSLGCHSNSLYFYRQMLCLTALIILCVFASPMFSFAVCVLLLMFYGRAAEPSRLPNSFGPIFRWLLRAIHLLPLRPRPGIACCLSHLRLGPVSCCRSSREEPFLALRHCVVTGSSTSLPPEMIPNTWNG